MKSIGWKVYHKQLVVIYTKSMLGMGGCDNGRWVSGIVEEEITQVSGQGGFKSFQGGTRHHGVC